jgi:hypothetical protein
MRLHNFSHEVWQSFKTSEDTIMVYTTVNIDNFILSNITEVVLKDDYNEVVEIDKAKLKNIEMLEDKIKDYLSLNNKES